MRLGGYIGCMLLLMSLTSCQKPPLDKALRGDFTPVENNEIITEYCQGCHIHRTFDPIPHTARVHALYDREPYSVATECRVCHLVRKDTWGTRLRKTVWPAEVIQEEK